MERREKEGRTGAFHGEEEKLLILLLLKMEMVILTKIHWLCHDMTVILIVKVQQGCIKHK